MWPENGLIQNNLGCFRNVFSKTVDILSKALYNESDLP